MQWRNLLFIHWPVPAEMLRPLIPAELEIDEFDGTAWIGLVPFTMRAVQPAFVPDIPGLSDIPTLSAFHECNVRTYVYPRGNRESCGVCFFSLDAASRPAVWAARKFFHLPYCFARINLQRSGDEISYAVERLHSSSFEGGAKRVIPAATMHCRWRVGSSLPQSQPGELSHFLTERYCLFSVDAHGKMHRTRIWHRPWPLRTAQLISLQDSLCRAAGIEVNQSHSPLLHHADILDVRAWPLERA